MTLPEQIAKLLASDLINKNSTHENAPFGHDCTEECGVELNDVIAASNPVIAPMRSGGKKHKRCLDCWEEYIDKLTDQILSLLASQEDESLLLDTDSRCDMLDEVLKLHPGLPVKLQNTLLNLMEEVAKEQLVKAVPVIKAQARAEAFKEAGERLDKADWDFELEDIIDDLKSGKLKEEKK